ncbi:MAG: hypothetical protein CSB47_09025 [Proteobacteria bacterium]|nr:MAG: hypothetical protein CSB47_09025 [Pseudomonadota bacterium]
MKHRLKIFSGLALFASTAVADLSYPGISGSLRTPSAKILPAGELQYQHNNYNDLSSTTDNTYNHVFAVGINSYIEFGGRLTNWYDDDRTQRPNGTLPGRRDLSANLKFRVPRLHSALPDIAFGIQDFGGEAVNFRSTYGVMSKTIGNTTASLGYAKSDGSDLDGEFASISHKLSDDFTIAADYLAEAFAVGLTINAKRTTGLPISLQVSGEKPKDGDWKELIALTLSLPLDKKLSPATKSQKTIALEKHPRDPTRFIAALERHGLSHLRLGTKAGDDLIYLENNVYNHSYLDALSVVLATAYQYLGGQRPVQIILGKQNIPLLAVWVDMKEYGEFIHNRPSSMRQSTKAWYPDGRVTNQVTWVARGRYDNRAPIDVKLRPVIRSNLGSEWGVFDYSAAVRADLKIPLGNVANVVVSGSVPVANSDLYDDDGAFANRRYKSKIDQAVLQKLGKLSPSTTALGSIGYGTINDEEYTVGQVEGVHTQALGKRQLYGKLAYYRNNDRAGDDQKIAVGGLRQHIDFLDMEADLSYGQFYNETRGVKAKVSKFYGDTALSAEIKYIDTDDLSGRLSITLPLTPRRDKLVGNTVLRGNQSWNYGIETTIKDPVVVGSNRVRPDFMHNPAVSYSLNKEYFDRGRLSPYHVINNLEQIRLRSRDLLGK